jgi:DNA polymerase-3 subunit alpha
MGIPVVPPDVNASDVEFSVVDFGLGNGQEKSKIQNPKSKIPSRAISFGLGAIRGVGEAAMRTIVEERAAAGPFQNIFDLCERIDSKQLTKAMLEILIKAGALDSLGPNREQHTLVLDRAFQAAASRQRDKARGQKSLFGDDSADAPGETVEIGLPDAPDWTHSQKLAAEKEVIGFYLTSHPLTQHADRLQSFATHTVGQLRDLGDGAEVLVGGMIGAIKKAATKKPSRNGHSKYVNFDLEDSGGVVRCIMWPDDFAREGELVEAEAIVLLKGRTDARGREPNIIVNKIYTLDAAEKEFTRQVTLKFRRGYHTDSDLQRARDVLGQFPGKTPVVVVVETWEETTLSRSSSGSAPSVPEPSPPPPAPNRLRAVLSTPLHVSARPELKTALASVLGSDGFRFQGAPNGKNGGA